MNADGAIAPRVGCVQRSQRLHADNGAAGRRDDRLVMHIEDLRGERGFKFAQEEAPVGLLDLDLRGEAPHRAVPIALGGAQRQNGAARQLLGAGAVFRRLCHSDAGADLPTLPGRCLDADERLGKARAQRRGENARRIGIVAACDRGKLVVLEAAEHRALGQGGPQTLGNGAQHGIASLAPHCVVDLAKAVEIEQHEGYFPGAAARHDAIERLQHHALVGKPGQRIFADELAHGFDARRQRTREPPRRPLADDCATHERDADRAGQRP